MTCPTCSRECNAVISATRRGEIATGCEACINAGTSPTSGHAAKFYRNAQKSEFRRELTQPWEKGFAKAYPDQARKEWGDEATRKFS